jgi:8-oxo-dGTP pyrophosphatase MutT (NUDIX family)
LITSVSVFDSSWAVCYTQPMNKGDIHKASGIIIVDRKVLVERSVGKEYFVHPGGKLEPGETSKQAVVRELKEELQIGVQEDDLEELTTTPPPQLIVQSSSFI